GNQKLTNFDGITSLKAVGTDLLVKNNPALTSITSLVNGDMQSVGNAFDVSGNPQLSSCQVLALKTALQAAGGIQGEDKSCCNGGCTACTGPACTGSSGGTEGQSGTFNGDVTIANAGQLPSLANVTEIVGNLTINNTSIPNLTGLGNLTH